MPIIIALLLLLTTVGLCFDTPKNWPKINNAGYCSWMISNSKIIRLLKEFAIKNNLPYMNRKWDKVDLSYISKYETSIKNEKLVKDLLDLGLKSKEVSERLGFDKRYVYYLMRRIKNDQNKYRSK